MLTRRDKILLFPLWIFSLLPLRILYLFADFFFVLIFYLFRYRKKVVEENLRKSFPEKTELELQKISRKFYKYFCQYFIESIYLIGMSRKECNQRYTYANADLLKNYIASGKNVIIAASHFGNWEWAADLNTHLGARFYGTYRPLSNKLFDRLFYHMRTKFGSVAISMKQTFRVLIQEKKQNGKYALYLVGDQRPGLEDLEYWTTFLNQESPVITGIEKLAKKFDCVVVFMHIEMPKKGYYKIEFKLIEENPVGSEPFAITQKYVEELEKMIINRPELWLWSHKRWKFKKEDYFHG